MAAQEVARTEEKLNVGKAKDWLREQGFAGRCLASRLGRLSKARNATLHPDVSLIRPRAPTLDPGGCCHLS